MPATATDLRALQGLAWARDVLNDESLKIEPLAGDASFRRYFRIFAGDRSDTMLLMDAPPEREDSNPFLDVDQRLRAAAIHAPEIIHFDSERGFGIIEDSGQLLQMTRP